MATRFKRISAITLLSASAIAIIDLLLGSGELASMLSLYFLLALAIYIVLASKTANVSLHGGEDEVFKNYQMVNIVRKAASGDKEARKYIIDTLNQFASLDNSEILMQKKSRIGWSKNRGKDNYLEALENILDRSVNERNN